ncbi:MAG: IS1380 family transposase [Planctomycetes bacterium]|nr:IS1380 family transposase [Planctomycetota bacterium]
MMQKEFKSKNEINKIGITNDTLTGRGGLALFVRYISKVNIYSLLISYFGTIRKNKKGLAVWNILKQVFCFFYDGTSRHLSYFDQLKGDKGYGAVIENSVEEMASSHQIKRFFQSFGWFCGRIFRKILKKMFIWRLKIEKPEEIELTIDTMVMDNDEAERRHGVQPTYKKEKGFQPLQIIWKGKIVDAIFRGGKKHGNYGKTVVNMVTDLVKVIRKEYCEKVTITLRTDSGFFDEKNFIAFDQLGIGFICTGKMYKGVKEYVGAQREREWGKYDNGHQEWDYIEFGYRCDTWNRFYRAIYTRPYYEGEQRLLDFARPDNVILTNIGVNPEVVVHCNPERQRKLVKAESIIGSHHQRGADELPHRGLKDFGFEELPFKRFAANTAFYYCMLISFFLFETFKEDVLEEVIPISSYATTVRRKALDFAAKIITTGGQITLKATKTVMDNLRFEILW